MLLKIVLGPFVDARETFAVTIFVEELLLVKHGLDLLLLECFWLVGSCNFLHACQVSADLNAW